MSNFADKWMQERVIIMPGERNNDQIIADHSIVGDFVKIPSYYIEEVKKMIVAFPGESHSEAYREGLLLLQRVTTRNLRAGCSQRRIQRREV